MVAYNFNPGILSEAKKLSAASRYSVVHLNHADALQYAPGLRADSVVFDTHNVLFEFHDRAARVARRWSRRLAHRVASRQMLRFERQAFRESTRVLVCSAAEKQSLARLGFVDNVEVISNGVDCDYFTASATDYFTNPPVAVFTGNMGYEPNHDAAVFFIREVLPLLHREEPAFEFLVVGKNPKSELVSLARNSRHVTVTGPVADVRQHIRYARVSVIPLRLGSGTRLKLLEAFSMGLPTVSTAIGAEGIECIHGEHLLIADGPQEFARQTLKLIRERALHARLASASRALATTRYDWHSIGRRLIEVYPS